MKILKKHFDAAVRHRWSTKTCIMAQCAMDNGTTLSNPEICGDYRDVFKSKIVQHIMSEFDDNFRRPGDESKAELQKLRNSLPIEI